MTVAKRRKIGKGEKGVVYGTGVYHSGEIKDTEYMQEAYEMGKGI